METVRYRAFRHGQGRGERGPLGEEDFQGDGADAHWASRRGEVGARSSPLSVPTFTTSVRTGFKLRNWSPCLSSLHRGPLYPYSRRLPFPSPASFLRRLRLRFCLHSAFLGLATSPCRPLPSSLSGAHPAPGPSTPSSGLTASNTVLHSNSQASPASCLT